MIEVAPSRPVEAAIPRAGAPTLWAFTAVIFCAAGLLFLVEPMVSKLLLPLAGGTPAVWTTSVLFFQAVLLLGYTYAHLLARLGLRAQLAVHACVLAVAAVALPITIPHGWSPPGAGGLVYWLLAVLAIAVGLPFFSLSSASPLLQHWFSRTGHRQAPDPYFLYRASNVGSMGALLAYPVLVEARLGLHQQTLLWSAGYVAFAVLALLAGVLALRRDAGKRVLQQVAAPPEPISNLRRARWVALAAVPSTWMLAVTSHLTTTVLPMPLLWVIPLAIYLLSFAIVFSPRPILKPRWMARALPFLVLPLAGTLAFRANGPLWLLFPLHLAAFGAGALALHGRLASDRPAASRLTEFYFWVALGGVTGGLLAAVVAPLVFPGYWEYPLAIAAGMALLATTGMTNRRSGLLDLALPAALGVAGLGLAWLLGPYGPVFGGRGLAGLSLIGFLRLSLLFTVPAVICFSFRNRPLRFGLGLAAVFAVSASPLLDTQPVLSVTRDFFGVHQVVDDRAAGRHLLMDGRVVHGSQNLDVRLRDLPTTYYSPSGPAGDFFKTQGSRSGVARVGLIGLGAGSLACYATPGQSWTFYEIDPAVVRFAEDPALFSYLHDCLPGIPDVVLGDGRLELARARSGSYDVLVLDAFGSDNVPAHLLTSEAIRLYFDKLAPGGALLVNVSNQYVDLRPIFANEAAANGLVCYGRVDTEVTDGQAREGKVISSWVVLARSTPDLAGLSSAPGWGPVPTAPGIPLWTDDYTNVLRVTRFA